MSVNWAKTEVKATLTHTSTGPRASSAWAAAASTWSGSATSAGIGSAVPPACSTSRTAPARPASPRASRATLAPRAAKASAAARPIPPGAAGAPWPRGGGRAGPAPGRTPPLAPVTTTTCPACSLLIWTSAGRNGWLRPAGLRSAGPRGGQPLGRLEQQGVDERLRHVAARLPLGDVVFLGEQAGRAARGPVALEPAGRFGLPALLMQGQRHGETAQQEGALGRPQGPLVRTVPVQVPVTAQRGVHRVQGGQRPGIAGRHRPPQGGEQQRGVDPVVIGSPLPAAGRVQAVGRDVGE